MSTPPDTFSKEELARHRAEAAKGIIPSLEIVAKFIRTIRKSWTAMPSDKKEGKHKVKKADDSQKEIDFF